MATTSNLPSTQLSTLNPTSTAGINVTGKDLGVGFLQTNSDLFTSLGSSADLNTINASSFFYTSLCNPLNWNQYFPYQIMILEENNSTRS